MFKSAASRWVTLAGASSLVLALVGLGKPRVEPSALSINSMSDMASASMDTAYFAGGCFWGVEAVFEHVKGVKMAISGFSGGSAKSPSYDQVSSGSTGHAESVEVIYDPSKVTYEELLEVFFTVAHDPTELNRQGPDVGPQYRSAIFYQNDEEKKAADAYVADLTQKKVYSKPIVTSIEAFKGFYAAEEYHQNYMDKHPNSAYIVYNDAPKLEHLKQQFPALYKKN